MIFGGALARAEAIRQGQEPPNQLGHPAPMYMVALLDKLSKMEHEGAQHMAKIMEELNAMTNAQLLIRHVTDFRISPITLDRTRMQIAMKSWPHREDVINTLATLTGAVYTAGPAPSGYLESYLNQWTEEFNAHNLDGP